MTIASNVNLHLLSAVLLHLNMTDIDPEEEPNMHVSCVEHTESNRARVSYMTIVTIDPDSGYADVVTVQTTVDPSTTSVLPITHRTYDATEQRFI